MDDEKKAAQQTDNTDAVGTDDQTADTKGEIKPKQQECTESKKPASKKAVAQAETAQAAEEKPAQQQGGSETSALREENARLQEQVLKLQAEAAVTRLAQSSGVDPKAVLYVSKLIDTDAVMKDGKCDDEKIKSQLDKILADLPQLKLHTDADNKKRVTPIGVAKDASENEQLGAKPTLAVKKWNRFNN